MQNIYDETTELIHKRVSVRTYNNELIKDSALNKLNEFIKRSKGPFKPKMRFEILNSKEEINGAKLGTCWIAGTLNKGEFTKAMKVKENELFIIISPIGYESDKKRIIDKLLKVQRKTRRRKEWKDIFFIENFNSPILDRKDVGEYEEVLENLRLAPSAANRQPWRVLKSEDSFHFYKDEGRSNLKMKGIDIQRVDMGIALCHFDLSCKNNRIIGEFINKEPLIQDKDNRFKYIISWRKN